MPSTQYRFLSLRMTSRRHRRTLALVAGLLWLAVGVTDAAGLAVCAYHGHTELHGVATSHDTASHESSPLQGPEAAHHGHGAHAVHAPTPDAQGTTHAEGHEEGLACALDDAGAHQACDCRFMCCAGVADTSTPQVSILEVSEATPETSAAPQPVSVGIQLSFHLVPFLLPPAEAPPAV
jgi:hypothetical protein